MKLEKIKKTYNDYKLELSWGQVEAIAAALGQNHSDPLADELYAEWQWYMERVPGPGEDEEQIEDQQKVAGEGGAPGAVEGEDLPIPMPPGSEAGTAPEGEGGAATPPSDEEMGGGQNALTAAVERADQAKAGVGLPEPEAEGGFESGPEEVSLPEPPRE